MRPQVCRRAEDRPGGTRTAPEERERPAHDRLLACAACLIAITSHGERTTVAGSHEHVGVNPHGHAFRIGCFATAINVVASGPETAFWSWFPGYTWQIALCLGCGAHVGWRFRSRDHHFYGLVLDRLVEVEGSA